MYVQLIDDVAGKTLAAFSDLTMDSSDLNKTQRAQKVGEEIAKLALGLKIETVVFDRGGFSYHGRVKSLADAARAGGLKF
jgi:large subunit ribosomal protein L18